MSSDMSACKTRPPFKSIKQRYKTQSGCGRKGSWQQNSGNLFGAFLIPIAVRFRLSTPSNPNNNNEGTKDMKEEHNDTLTPDERSELNAAR